MTKINVRHVVRRVLPVMLILTGTVFVVLPGAGAAAHDPVDLGGAGAYSVIGGQTVTNTGPSVVDGDVGVSPGAAAPGVPSAVVNGTVHRADAVAGQAQADLTIAYDDAAGRASDGNLTGQDLGGLTHRGRPHVRHVLPAHRHPRPRRPG